MKIYSAKISVQATVEVQVQAPDETIAKQKARKISLENFPKSASISNLDLTVVRESPIELGARVQHKIFGIGTVTDLTSVVSGGGDRGWKATVEFDDAERGTQSIAIMPGKPHLELVDA